MSLFLVNQPSIGGNGGSIIRTGVNTNLPGSGGVSVISSPTDGTRQIGGSSIPGLPAVEVRSNVAPAVAQTDLLQINLAANADVWVASFGAIWQFIDMSATALARAAITMIDPNGTPHDLAALTKLKTSGDGFVTPYLPAGLYTFQNISGGAITSKYIYAYHTGARNLA